MSTVRNPDTTVVTGSNPSSAATFGGATLGGLIGQMFVPPAGGTTVSTTSSTVPSLGGFGNLFANPVQTLATEFGNLGSLLVPNLPPAMRQAVGMAVALPVITSLAVPPWWGRSSGWGIQAGLFVGMLGLFNAFQQNALGHSHSQSSNNT